ncbi:MAG TPA: M56 family metallopeptidase [Terracidiphilus sp.]|nr:M56 family metallopeptidase [Terracidiphilus sp.]
MIAALVPLILQAALQALFAAAVVWFGLRVLRVANVLVQKAAWGLVLVAALALPMVPHWQPLSAWATFRLSASTLDPLTESTPALNSAKAPTASPAPGSAELSGPMVQTSAIAQTSSFLAPESDSGRYPAQSRPSDHYVAPAASGSGVDSTPDAPPALSSPLSIPQPAAPAAKALSPVKRPMGLAGFALLIYLAVFVALLLRLFFGLASAIRIWIAAEPIAELPGLDRASAGMHLRSSVRVASPVNIGSGIVLPADYAGWNEEKLRIVLAHERSHVCQGDFYLQILAGLYACLFWFSPLGWWLKRKLHELGEAISDRAGLEEAASRSSYAQLLLEFAALPRPTLTGVAMARTSHLSQRIERLLNESSFRQAFAAGGRRALLSVLLVPVALIAATTLVRVEAATPAPAAQAQPATPASAAGQSTPEQVTEPAPAPAAAPTPEAAPAPPSTPAPAPEPTSQSAPPPPPAAPGESGLAPVAPQAPDSGIAPMAPMPPMPPMPHINIRIPGDAIRVQVDPEIRAEIAAAQAQAEAYRGYDYSNFDGDSYALVGDPGSKTRIQGWDANGPEEIEKARKIAHGHFLWFRHEGKSYIVDEPAIVAQVEAMNKPMDELGTQMKALGEQMRTIGQQQRDLGKQMRDVSVPTPDLTKQMDELNAAVATLKSKQGGTISQKELGDLQREVGRIQGELGALQGKIGAQQGQFGEGMGKFGQQQGELGGQMGKLGAQMGQIAHENQAKVKGIINDSLSNGKAKPVQ